MMIYVNVTLNNIKIYILLKKNLHIMPQQNNTVSDIYKVVLNWIKSCACDLHVVAYMVRLERFSKSFVYFSKSFLYLYGWNFYLIIVWQLFRFNNMRYCIFIFTKIYICSYTLVGIGTNFYTLAYTKRG